tara:strand:- start:40 stop:1728 length:1689 start_codon:yes stop_codon:yes gene_type:complete
MRYWKALAFCQQNLSCDAWKAVSLDQFSHALGCTRRNSQLLIKRLIKEDIIEWKPGIGRGNLPTSRRLKDVNQRLTRQAEHLVKQGQVESALSLIDSSKRNQFLSDYLEQYQTSQKKAHILQIPFYRGTHDLDPIGINRRTEQHIADYLYANLLKANPNGQGFQGDLAQSWKLVGNTLSITLRKSLYFHDGSPLHAGDVKAHFERLMASNSVSKQMFRFIEQVIVKDTYSIDFVSYSLPNLMPKLLTKGAMGICKQVDDKIYGSGSFILTEQTPWITRLKANPRYHGYRPWIDGIEIWNIGDKAKEFEPNSDVVHGSHLKQNREGFTHYHQWEQGCVHSMLNPYRHPWMNKRSHRHWLQRVLCSMPSPQDSDCEEITQASGMISSPKSLRFKEAQTKLYDVQTKPSPPLIVMTYQLATHIAVSQQVVTTLKNRGIPCEFKILPYPDFNQEETLTNADIIITGEVFSEDIEMAWLGWFLSTNSNEACLNDKDKAKRDQQIIDIMSRSTSRGRLRGFETLEKNWIKKGIYQPLYHVKQDLNISDKISAPELLANGWIDFNQITM